MEHVFHEKQEGSLCAQHCLNALLQGAYFNAVDLASIGHQLDEAERDRMAEGGLDSADFNRFLARPSSNVDDSGFFSVQVIEEALKNVGLRLVRFDSPDAAAIRANPTYCTAFICNLMQHWLTIRKIGNQWFNLNSLLSAPHLLTDTYVSLYLEQLRTDGYSIFIVEGDLPQCAAHDILLSRPAVQLVPPPLLADLSGSGDDDDDDVAITGTHGGSSTGADNVDSGDGLTQALEASRREALAAEQEQLQAALAASCQDGQVCAGAAGGSQLPSNPAGDFEMDDEVAMRHAVEVSLGSATGAATSRGQSSASTPAAAGRGPATASAEELRQKRLAYFNRQQQQPPQQQQGVAVAEKSTPAEAAVSLTVDSRVAEEVDMENPLDFSPDEGGIDDLTEEEQLQLALAMSTQ